MSRKNRSRKGKAWQVIKTRQFDPHVDAGALAEVRAGRNPANRACDGKVKYGQRAAAAYIAERAQIGVRLERYRCPYCSAWHLTSHLTKGA